MITSEMTARLGRPSLTRPVALCSLVAVMALASGCKTMEQTTGSSTGSASGGARSTGATEGTVAAAQARPSGSPASDGQIAYTPTIKPTQVERSAAEKRLQRDSANFSNVVFGGFAKNMLLTMPIEVLNCMQRFKSGKARDDCIAVRTVVRGLEGVNKGYAVAKLQEAGQNRVRALESVTADMAADNARLQSVVDASEAVLTESQARLKQLRNDVDGRKMAANQAKAESQREQENLNTLNAALKDARSTRDEYVKAGQNFKGTPAERRNLDAEIAAMSAKVSKLEANAKKLSEALVPFSA